MTASPPRTVVLVTAGGDLVLSDATSFSVQRIVVDDTMAAFPDLLAERIGSAAPLAVCIAPDVPQHLALAMSTALDNSHPEIGVVLVRTPSADLWQAAARSGVHDIVDPGAVRSDLVPALESALARGERLVAAWAGNVAAAHRGKVIVVLSPKGGSGKTMVASNIAVALARSGTGDTVLVDLDCVFGDVASILGLVPDHTAGQLAVLPSFDSTTLKVFLTPHPQSGLFVLAGSGSPEEGEALTSDIAVRILEMLAQDFAYVVVDTAAGLDERALGAIDVATDCVFLASLDVASIRNLVKEIGALDRLGTVGSRRHFILNRADTRVGLEVADVEAAVGMAVDAALPSSRVVPLTMNRGRPLVLEEPDAPVSAQLLSFAQRFLPHHDDTPNDHRGRFARRRH